MTPQAHSPAYPTVTGITEALAGLQDLHEIPTADHVVLFTAMHTSLIAALSSIDDV